MTDFKSEPNMKPLPLESNIVNAPGGSVMKGGVFQSPNFRSGASGWQIRADGVAEFQDVNIGHRIISVDTNGNIQTAINLINATGKGGKVVLRAGTYTIDYDITLYSNITIEGSGMFATILDFNDNAKQIKIVGTIKTETGTFAMDDDVSVTGVVGTTTSFTSAAAGDFLWIVDDWYEIASISDNTNLVLVDAYHFQNGDLSGEAVLIATIKEKIGIKDLTVTNCRYTTNLGGAGSDIAEGNIYIKCARQLNFENIRSTFADNTTSSYPGFGIFVNATSHSKFENVECSDNESDGFKGVAISFNSFNRCLFFRNEDAGLFLDSLVGEENFITNCSFRDNSANYELRLGNAGNAINTKILGNSIFGKAQVGGSASSSIIFSNNKIDGQIALSGSNCVISGNYIKTGRTSIGILMGGGRDNVITGNILDGCYISLATYLIQTVKSNESDLFLPTDNQRIVYMKNTSGGALALGDLVILKSVAGGNEITTTTSQGDDKVFGVVMETIADTAYGAVLVSGKTVSLKVDGTTDIAIGDFIGTFTTAKIGMKCSAGDMAIAIALEAYTTDDSNGVIDALVITPRKI